MLFLYCTCLRLHTELTYAFWTVWVSLLKYIWWGKPSFCSSYYSFFDQVYLSLQYVLLASFCFYFSDMRRGPRPRSNSCCAWHFSLWLIGQSTHINNESAQRGREESHTYCFGSAKGWVEFFSQWKFAQLSKFGLFVFVARGDRMKEAKSEAETIIAAYRAEMEANYQMSLAKVKNSTHLCFVCEFIRSH